MSLLLAGDLLICGVVKLPSSNKTYVTVLMTLVVRLSYMMFLSVAV